MSTHKPAEDLAAFLSGKVANGVTLTAAANLFARSPIVAPGFPDVCVFLWESGGYVDPIMGTPALRGTLYYPSVQVRVRGTSRKEGPARQMARDVRDLLHRKDISTYISCLVREASPIPLGENAATSPEFGLNVELIYREAA